MKKIIIIILCTFIIVWGVCILKCEINTILYGSEFEEEYKQTNMIGGNPQPKVLKYTKWKAKIYYVNEMGGDIIVFEKKNGKWIMEEWVETVWSKGGTADGFMWPYGR